MESNITQRTIKRFKRARRIRSGLHGTAEKPRLCVVKSNQHISVQLIDDEAGVTLGSASTFSKEMRVKNLGKSKEGARIIGQKIAEAAKQKQITRCIFDRGSRKYHGIIAEVGNAAREGGLQF